MKLKTLWNKSSKLKLRDAVCSGVLRRPTIEPRKIEPVTMVDIR